MFVDMNHTSLSRDDNDNNRRDWENDIIIDNLEKKYINKKYRKSYLKTVKM